ncbi:hypothetical protein ACFL59_06220 [Planctomycetota bacterium]
MSEPERRRRAEERWRRMTVRRTHLGAAEPDLKTVRGTAAVSLVSQLTRESWSLGGLAIPSYSRSETAYRFVPGRPT